MRWIVLFGCLFFVFFGFFGCQPKKVKINTQRSLENWEWSECGQAPFEVITITESFRLRKVSGRVVNEDAYNEFPLPGAVISLRRIKNSRIYRATADKKGRFSFFGLPWGCYEFAVCCSGWETLRGFIALEPSACKEKIKFKLPLGK